MSMNDSLRKMAVLLERRQDALFSYDVDKQRKYIEKLRVPRDEMERSYFQYKCQMQFNGMGLTAFLNILSFPIVSLYLIKYGRNTKVDKLKQAEMVFFRDGKPENILPKSLKERYQSIECSPLEGFVLKKEDKRLIKELVRRYPFSWHFILKCLIKIGRYSYVIEEYSPKAIVVCAEYSFTSSVLTEYCNRRKIKHIDVMHGEKMYYMRDAFFKFDECYIWDDYYKKILTSMKADENQFIIEVPTSLRFETELVKTNTYDYTYYLARETEEVLKRISNILKQLYMSGKRISIRPHPRYSNIDTVRQMFSFANIEDTSEVSIEQSLFQTKTAISLYSTVLNQAIYNSVPVIIDDLSNPGNYNKLKELGYICLYKEHRLLSEIVRD